MKTVIKNSASKIDHEWDSLSNSVYQNRDFLIHSEKHNPCKQRYYLGYEDDVFVAGAVVYSLKVNVLTFAKYCINLPMTVIGIPISVDAHGMVGNIVFFEELISDILKKERGIILCLNYNTSLNIKNIVEMETLPTLIYDKYNHSWENYLQSLRHNYRRRILNAEKKFSGIKHVESLCSQFTQEHYQLYLNIINRTQTKLETLSFDFFSKLSEEFHLHSFYKTNQLITWHITTLDREIYYFLFGGLKYDLRNKYDSYYNNLIQILKGGIKLNSTSINLGQTAELSKKRLGAQLIEKKMFVFHRNILIRTLFRLSKKMLTYKMNLCEANVFK
ncbi:hypothetical protein FEDK69T_19000 [Flavobacterium enshiense DK69]|uniref:hypothetical protein n=1 Tax=Flavobacterium enshiense TaxID=1341165 RepID=UPI0003C573D6|nr:hypothetical protein [Flavobacterium enshiense]ESU22642.1 hypothetical protein FEDK69T_19000 [Flavobacterium enshiense DK69]